MYIHIYIYTYIYIHIYIYIQEQFSFCPLSPVALGMAGLHLCSSWGPWPSGGGKLRGGKWGKTTDSIWFTRCFR